MAPYILSHSHCRLLCAFLVVLKRNVNRLYRHLVVQIPLYFTFMFNYMKLTFHTLISQKAAPLYKVITPNPLNLDSKSIHSTIEYFKYPSHSIK